MPVAKRKRRIMITMDVRLVEACDTYIEKLRDSGVPCIDTKSDLIERALVNYFETLDQLCDSLLKGGNKTHEN